MYCAKLINQDTRCYTNITCKLVAILQPLPKSTEHTTPGNGIIQIIQLFHLLIVFFYSTKARNVSNLFCGWLCCFGGFQPQGKQKHEILRQFSISLQAKTKPLTEMQYNCATLHGLNVFSDCHIGNLISI